jgi:hypothetical protein
VEDEQQCGERETGVKKKQNSRSWEKKIDEQWND